MTAGEFWSYGFGPLDELLARFFAGMGPPGSRAFERRIDIGDC